MVETCLHGRRVGRFGWIKMLTCLIILLFFNVNMCVHFLIGEYPSKDIV